MKIEVYITGIGDMCITKEEMRILAAEYIARHGVNSSKEITPQEARSWINQSSLCVTSIHSNCAPWGFCFEPEDYYY